MRVFLLPFNIRNIQDTKNDIDEGSISHTLTEVCNGIQASLFLSHNIRRNVRCYLFDEEQKIIIELRGDSLKYMGTDLRSISILLIKAFNLTKFLKEEEEKTSSPGIIVRKTYPCWFFKKTLPIDNTSFYYISQDKGVETIDLNKENYVLLIPELTGDKVLKVIDEFNFTPLKIDIINLKPNEAIIIFQNKLDRIEYDW
ncbi:MAG: hypothetical protein ACTSYR_06130 [Candidatus Odinarchaeia archaeon]